MHPSLLALAATVSATFLIAALSAGDAPPDPGPSPEWTPAEVVRLQVEALQRNDHPHEDAGIETAFEFASPGNRAATGPLPRFARMVHGPVYRDMLDFERAEYGRVRVEGDRAAQEVTLVRPDGRRVTFLFGLSRQPDGDCAGCWMTDAVVRRDAPADGTIRA